MHLDSIDELLRCIDNNIQTLSAENVETVLKTIDQFQQDPSILQAGRGRNRLQHYIEVLTENFFKLPYDEQLLRCKVFYTLSKVVTWKKIIHHLPTNIYQLTNLMEILPQDNQVRDNWYISYLILSWIYLLTLSPFKLQDVDKQIYHRTLVHKKLPSLNPIVAHIHSQLFIRNSTLFDYHKKELDLLTINCILKECIKTTKSYDKFIDKKTLDSFTSSILNGEKNENGTDIVRLKALPKLFRLHAFHQDWESLEDIISWILSHLDNQFTNFRFRLAHSYAKIIHCLIYDLDDKETAFELIQSCVDNTTQLIKSTPWDLLDNDRLHTNLLIIAELSNTVATCLPHLCGKISEGIIPFTSRFQQLKVNNIKGAQVKDASNFICWSFARIKKSNQKNIPQEAMVNIFLNLLMCSTFDRDLLVRKSASAALQEMLGRYISSSKILDNSTILKIIELPITNLSEIYSTNTWQLYECFTKCDEYQRFADFVVDWLFNYNLLQNYDLKVVKLTIKSLHDLLLRAPRAIHFVEAKIEEKICSMSPYDTIESTRILSLLIELESDRLLSPQCSDVLCHMRDLSQNVIGSINHNERHSDNNPRELFKFLTILKYWVFQMDIVDDFALHEQDIKTCFHIVRNAPVPSIHNMEFAHLFRKIVARLSRSPKHFESAKDECFFWKTYQKYVRYNNTLTCCVLPDLEPSRFTEIFYMVLPLIDSTCKSQLLDSLSEHLLEIVDATGSNILFTITELLNDYTITEQGDVGRLVRTSAAKIIAMNSTLFWSLETLTDSAISNLVRLSGEQVEELKRLCFSILCDKFQYSTEVTKENYNYELLKFQHFVFHGKSPEFWKGYIVSAGAIHFSDSQVRSAIDEFLIYYYSLTQDSERLELCNCLVRIIPSAKELSELQNNSAASSARDVTKIAVLSLNFWQRIMESGIRIDRKFNFKGVYAKIYNLNLLKGSSILRVSTIKLLPHLINCHIYASGGVDKNFANTIIMRLLVLAQRESQLDKSGCSLVERTATEGLAQIFLDTNSLQQLERLKAAVNENKNLIDLSELQVIL